MYFPTNRIRYFRDFFPLEVRDMYISFYLSSSEALALELLLLINNFMHIVEESNMVY